MHPRRRVFVERHSGTLSLHLGFWVGLSLQYSSHQSGLPLSYVFFIFPFFQIFCIFFGFLNRISRTIYFYFDKRIEKVLGRFGFLVSSWLVLLNFLETFVKILRSRNKRFPHMQRIFVEKKGLNWQDLDFFPIAIYISTISSNK